MSPRSPRIPLATVLRAAADAYQTAQVIPHCAVCTRPCCRLDVLVLELSWKQVKVLWQRDEPRAVFDQQLAAGQGPEEIRAADGRYFAHRKACPAYDEMHKNCRVYGQPIKPLGCSDFPVYGDGDCITADLRCEAVDLDALVASVECRLGPAFRVIPSADRDFPFLVSLVIRRAKAARK